MVESLISIDDAARLLAIGGRAPSRRSIYRWAQSGYGARGLRLRTVRVSARLYTSPAWVDDFNRARMVIGETPEPVRKPAPRTRSAQRRAAVKQAERLGV